MTILLKSAKVVCSKSAYHKQILDLFIEDGKIKKIGQNLSYNVDKEIHFPNLHVSLGWFDSSVCFGDPGYEERETMSNGLSVASQSGFTTILLNPNTRPIPDTGSHIHALLSKAANAITTMYPIGAMTQNSEGTYLAELFDMKSSGAIAFGDFKTSIAQPNLLKIALLYAQNFGGLILSYPQENSLFGRGLVNEGHSAIRVGLRGAPSISEEIQIMRDLAILKYTGGRLHIPTISTKKAIKIIRQAKNEGLCISCSVAIHHLVYSDESITTFDTNYKVLPPLRTKEDVQALREGVLDGTIDIITTDHSPIDLENKNLEFENAMYGTIGLESAFGVLNDLFGLEHTIKLLTKGRSLFILSEPEILEGKSVNLTLFNPEIETVFQLENIKSTSKNCAFINHLIKGKVYGVINGCQGVINGEVI